MGRTKTLAKGSILRVQTPSGYSYLQYVGKHTFYGDAVRVLPGIFPSETTVDFDRLVERDGYLTFYCANAAVKLGLVTLVGSRPLRDAFELPCRVRSPALNRFGHTGEWLISDGTREIRRVTLSDIEKSLPIGEVVSHPELVDRIAGDWNPFNYVPVVAPGIRRDDDLINDSVESHGEEQSVKVEHFLYFSDERSASEAAHTIQDMGFGVDQHGGDDDMKWLVLVTHPAKLSEIDLDHIELELTKIAEKYRGEYDGRGIDLRGDR